MSNAPRSAQPSTGSTRRLSSAPHPKCRAEARALVGAVASMVLGASALLVGCATKANPAWGDALGSASLADADVPPAEREEGGAGQVRDASALDAPSGTVAPVRDASLGSSNTNGAALDAGSAPDGGPREGAPDLGGALEDASTPQLGDAAPSTNTDPDAGFSAQLARRLEAIRDRLQVLEARTMEFWLSHGPDEERGGFHATLDRQGSPVAPLDKSLLQQVRHLWALSTWYERRGPDADVARMAHEQFAFVQTSYLDPVDGAFRLKVDRSGQAIVDGRKQLFAESYAIYALATYGRVLDRAAARDLALSRFLAIDAARHDAANGGYDQTGDPGFLVAGGSKGANTHLHLMEAFTALYEATANELVGERLLELMGVLVEDMVLPPGYVHAEFSLDFTPVGESSVSFGHDLETAWLVLEADRVLADRGSKFVDAALALAEHSAVSGFDAERGGYFERGQPGAGVIGNAKVWWVQFEALLGLWALYENTRATIWLERLEQTLTWVEATEDVPVGEWFATRSASGDLSGVDYKGDEWKASYHSVRGLVWLRDAIELHLREGSARRFIPTD